MRVLHISPTFFSDHSFIGGGERYVLELARAMADKEEAVFLSFADKPASLKEGALRIEHLQRQALLKGHPIYSNPLSRRFIHWTRWADVVHCHQIHTHSTDLAIILGRMFRKRVFVTDLGGGHKYALSSYLPLLKRTHGFLLISEYSKQLWQQAPAKARCENLEVIYGGVDTMKFTPGNGNRTRSRTALFVGRLMPHKGINYLVDAIREPLSLDLVGRPYHKDFFDLLKSKGAGKRVAFHTGIGDAELAQKYREALVTVLPSVYTDCYDNYTPVPELLGLVALESLACGTPVILTDVASLPEIVEDGVNGFLVPPNDAEAIREKLDYLYAHPEVADAMGRRGREKVLQQFTWELTAHRCLEAYQHLA